MNAGLCCGPVKPKVDDTLVDESIQSETKRRLYKSPLNSKVKWTRCKVTKESRNPDLGGVVVVTVIMRCGMMVLAWSRALAGG